MEKEPGSLIAGQFGWTEKDMQGQENSVHLTNLLPNGWLRLEAAFAQVTQFHCSSNV
jgi:hypothetical protein